MVVLAVVTFVSPHRHDAMGTEVQQSSGLTNEEISKRKPSRKLAESVDCNEAMSSYIDHKFNNETCMFEGLFSCSPQGFRCLMARAAILEPYSDLTIFERRF